MKKSVLCLFILFLFSVNFLAFTNPASSVEWLLAANTKLDLLRNILAVVLLSYLLLPIIKFRRARLLLECAGAVVIVITLGSAFFIPYTDQLHIRMYPLDMITALESFVVLMLMGINSETTKAIKTNKQVYTDPALTFKSAKTV